MDLNLGKWKYPFLIMVGTWAVISYPFRIGYWFYKKEGAKPKFWEVL